MKSVGMTRKLDGLGRIVIPKELRRGLRIGSGDSVEIFTSEDGELILKKYSSIVDIASLAKKCADDLAKITSRIICVTDKDEVIAVSKGANFNFLGKSISKELKQIINERQIILASRYQVSFVPVLRMTKILFVDMN